MFFQSGGCCDGSLPICFDEGELIIGDHDVLLGRVGGCPFYIDARQYEVWKHTQLILDVSDGRPEGFSLPAPNARHFITRSRVFTPEELVIDRQSLSRAWPAQVVVRIGSPLNLAARFERRFPPPRRSSPKARLRPAGGTLRR